MNEHLMYRVSPRIDTEGTVVTIHPPLDETGLVALKAELEQAGVWDAAWQPTAVGETDRREGLDPMKPHTMIRLSSEGPNFHAKNRAVDIASWVGRALTHQDKDVKVTDVGAY